MYINIFIILSIISMSVCLSTYFTNKDLSIMILSSMFTIVFYITFLLYGNGEDDDDDYGEM